MRSPRRIRGVAIVRGHVVVSGRVQGVFFRQKTLERARQRGITGWVRNRDDGRVEAVFEGDDDAVRSMIDWCRRGPRLAVVEEVSVDFEEATGEFDGFDYAW